MKKHKVMLHIRNIIQINVADLSTKTGIPENHIHAVEKGTKTIPPKLIAYYSSCLKVDLPIMEALLGDFAKHHYVFGWLQNIATSILLKYLELGQWMCSYNEKIKE